MLMTTNDKKTHWQNVYNEKKPEETSWFQEFPMGSLDYIQKAMSELSEPPSVIDVGSGASQLLDSLVAIGIKRITALDIAAGGLRASKARLGELGENIKWVVSDVTQWHPDKQYDLWHDRAVYHFLTRDEDRQKYMKTLKAATRRGSFVIISGFAIDGPIECSGLPVRRLTPAILDKDMGPAFERLAESKETHITPWGAEQSFQYCLYERVER